MCTGMSVAALASIVSGTAGVMSLLGGLTGSKSQPVAPIPQAPPVVAQPAPLSKSDLKRKTQATLLSEPQGLSQQDTKLSQRDTVTLLGG